MSFSIESAATIQGGWKYAVSSNGKIFTFDEFYIALLNEKNGRATFTEFLRAIPFDAYYWETAPVTTLTQNRPFEFVIIESKPLKQIKGDERAFANQFNGKLEDVVTFSNLGKDATLVVPTPNRNRDLFPHLASFIRRAKPSQIDALWIALAKAYYQSISMQPLWISTAGLGVPWLHIRLDNRPKYYKHQPYIDSY